MNESVPAIVILALAAVTAVGFSDASWADQPAASCDYSSHSIAGELKLNVTGEGRLSGTVDDTEFECQVTLASIKDCRRCASIVNYILTIDREACEIKSPNAPLDKLPERFSLHIFRAHAEIGLLGGMSRVVCRNYTFDYVLPPLSLESR